MMKMFKRPWLAVSLAVALLGGVGISVSLAQSDAMADQMEMMKKMMMSRPKAMAKADAQIQKVKAKAVADGKYACCLRHSCDSCALKMGQCPCGMNAANDKPVCHECKGGWHAGDGAIPGKTADQIKTMPPMGGEM
ncbi:MAG: hypothetical protein O2968_19180 [Acidobacteria bacterium]|nr:hypothetical protein [Acidobacteriota bacterium]